MAGKVTEQAVLIVNGVNFKDWESVMVRNALMDHPYYHFRFTCSEDQPIAANLGVMRIKPGDTCEITLAGEPAFSGLVSTRQVFYDKVRHYVEIQGASWVAGLSTTSIISQTGEWKNVTWEQFARAVLKDTGINLKVEGGQLPQYKYPRISVAPGTPILEALETYGRPLGMEFTSNTDGDLVAIVGPSGGTDVVTEGIDILEGREIIYNEGMASGNYGVGQGTGSDQKNGPQVAHVPFAPHNEFPTLGKQYAPQVFPLEVPTSDNSIIKGRVTTERNWQAEDQITVFVTEYGWLKASGGLWQRNQTVVVHSPMLLENLPPLRAKSVTFMQDNNIGTRTILELCNERALYGSGFVQPGT